MCSPCTSTTPPWFFGGTRTCVLKFQLHVKFSKLSVYLDARGQRYVKLVKAGNVMAVRTTMLCYLASALGLVFILEQPGCSKFSLMPRWQHFCQTVCHVRRLQSVFLFFFPLIFFLYITFVAALRIVTVFGHFRYPRLPLTMAVTALDILESVSL